MKNLLTLCLFSFLLFVSCEKQTEKRPVIAILTPTTHPSLEQIEKGFVQSIEAVDPNKYHFAVFNAHGNKMLMRSEIEEIARQHPALVFTIGTSASQMTAEVFRKKELITPIVFTSVNDPVGFHIVNSEESPGGTITGVKEILNLEEELAILFRYKPDLKSLLLVYNPTEPGLEKDQKEIERLLKEKHTQLITVEVFKTNEILSKVSPFMERADAMIVLKDNTVVAGLDVLVKLCNQHQIPLMASDLDSPDKGATFGFGVYEIDFGIEAAKKALQILDEGIPPSHIPVTPVSHFDLRINKSAAQKQGIDPLLSSKRGEK